VEGVGAERGADDFIGGHPAEADADGGGEGDVAADDEALDVGAAPAEVGVGEAVDDGVALDVAVAEAGLPVAELFHGGLAELEGEVPGGVSSFEVAGGGGGAGAAVVDGFLAMPFSSKAMFLVASPNKVRR